MNIYTTEEWKGYGKYNYYCNRYRLEGNKVVKYLCHRQKLFGLRASGWFKEEIKLDSWRVGDDSMPNWIKGLVNSTIK